MDYNALAQRIVALGVGKDLGDGWFQVEWIIGTPEQPPQKRPVRSIVFCNDGRVVLALMEKVNAYWHLHIRIMGHRHIEIYHSHGSRDETEWTLLANARGDSLAIAICEACVEALEVSDE